ncbi:MAG: hypothetical protein RL685_7648, partial [Pseudomonadota bacterium]
WELGVGGGAARFAGQGRTKRRLAESEAFLQRALLAAQAASAAKSCCASSRRC